MRTPKPLPARLDGRPFSTDEARAAGIPRRRTRARDLDQLFRATRLPANVDKSLENVCRAYATRMPESQFFSHVTAAGLLGLPLSRQHETATTLHVSAVAPTRAPRMAGIVGHQSSPASIRATEVSGLRVSSAVETWCQLSVILPLDDLIAMGDALVRRQRPFATMEELTRAVTEWDGRRGARRLREAQGLVRPGVDSPKETAIRLIIVRAGLPEPEVNAVIRNEYGAFLALGDLVYPAYRVLVEYDGAHHFGDQVQFYRDVDRLDDVMEERWRVVRLNKTHLARKATVIAKVRTALIAGGWRP